MPRHSCLKLGQTTFARRAQTRLQAMAGFLFAILVILMPTALCAATPEVGRAAEAISKASALAPQHGALIISVRSELFLVAELDVYFVREGGDVSNDDDVFRFSRAQPTLALGNKTTKYKVRAYQLPAGRYRLAGHGAKCTKVPGPDERCLADISFAGIGETVSFPSRGYDKGAPVIEVRAGELTVAGDFGLTARNTLEWSEIPADKLSRLARKFASLPPGPKPEIAEDYRLKYPLRPRSMADDRGRRY